MPFLPITFGAYDEQWPSNTGLGDIDVQLSFRSEREPGRGIAVCTAAEVGIGHPGGEPIESRGIT